MFRIILMSKLAMLVLFAVVAPASAQTNDPRVFQLEEQVRQLNGRIEELNFIILQMQEDLRKNREDLEYRIQELEDQQGSLVPADDKSPKIVEVEPSVAPTQNGVAVATAPIAPTAPAATATTTTGPRLGVATTGEPPRNLGAIKLDENGNVIDTSVDFSAQSVERSIDGDQVASVSGQMNPEQLYQAGYGYVLNGDYALAEGVFSTFVATYPNDPLIADARFWLGESMLAQGNFEGAADVFIETRTLYPNAGKAPETMLKIGTIMAALGNREVACVTFEDALKTHTNMSSILRNKIGDERIKAKC